MAIEIVSCSIKNCDFPWLCGSLPEAMRLKLRYAKWTCHRADDSPVDLKHTIVKQSCIQCCSHLVVKNGDLPTKHFCWLVVEPYPSEKY